MAEMQEIMLKKYQLNRLNDAESGKQWLKLMSVDPDRIKAFEMHKLNMINWKKAQKLYVQLQIEC